MTVEVRFSDEEGKFPVEPQFTVEPQQETTIIKDQERLLKVFCDQSDDIGWIHLLSRGGLQVTRDPVRIRTSFLVPVKINAPWAGIIRGDMAEVVFPDGKIARITHNVLRGGGY